MSEAIVDVPQEGKAVVKIGKFDSWNVISDSEAIKECDKSFFDYNGSGVPIDVRGFFDAENMPYGGSISLKLVFDGKEHYASISKESSETGRTRIFWGSDLGELFNAEKGRLGGAVAARFKRISHGNYSISLQALNKIHNAFSRFMNGYLDAKKQVFADNPFGTFVRSDIPSILYGTGLVDQKEYLVTGSVGQGNWALIPWICIFYRPITTSATKGIYIVYLLSRDAKSLYLTFNQGCTDIRRTHSKKETINIMRQNASKLVEKLDARGFRSDELINLGDELTELGEMYQKGTIFYKEYKVNDIPSEVELVNDLSKMMDIYKDYIAMCTNIIWLPKAEDYSSGITKEDWIRLLNDENVLDPGWGNLMAMFYTEPQGATCKQIGLKFVRDPASISGMATNFAKKIYAETKCRLLEDSGAKKYWPILFQGHEASSDTPGNWVWKLRPELYEALTEVNILRFLEIKGGEGKLSTKDAIEKIKKYIAAKGFKFDDGLVENYYLSLKSKPFVILAGTSGTGKTRLVRLFAEAVGATTQNGRYLLVPVRPDWSDSTDLFGHVNLNGKFVAGKILDFIKAAKEDIGNSYFLCLDEMNLARVEYYLSDILSIIETRECTDGEIVTDPLITEDYYGADEAAKEKYGVLGIPENLFIIGTVNMDETTFPFSRKVLDRANTIEFSTVELLADFDAADGQAEVIALDNTFLKSNYVFFSQCAEESEFVDDICVELQEINKILESANAHVGYRVRDEIAFYMMNNKKAGLLDRNKAFDNEIMQKILPRIQGSSTSIKKMLCDLFKHCAGEYESYQTENDDVSSKMLKAIQKDNCKYKESARKIAFMVRRFEEDGFTAYWL